MGRKGGSNHELPDASMSRPDPDPGRGQLHRRSERSWRDETNPTGSAHGKDEPAPESDATPEEARAGWDEAGAPEEAQGDVSPANAGPGGGGATEWSGRSKQYEGLHGGPSRKS